MPQWRLVAALRCMDRCGMDFSGGVLDVVARASRLPDPADPGDVLALSVNDGDMTSLPRSGAHGGPAAGVALRTLLPARRLVPPGMRARLRPLGDHLEAGRTAALPPELRFVTLLPTRRLVSPGARARLRPFGDLCLAAVGPCSRHELCQIAQALRELALHGEAASAAGLPHAALASLCARKYSGLPRLPREFGSRPMPRVQQPASTQGIRSRTPRWQGPI